jgi:hypothetical protein
MTNRTSEFASDACCGDGDEGGGNAPSHERCVCQCYAPTCSHYLCAVCGVAVPWHKNLMITNPTISGRFCNSCIDVEAAYHGTRFVTTNVASVSLDGVAGEIGTRTHLPVATRRTVRSVSHTTIRPWVSYYPSHTRHGACVHATPGSDLPRTSHHRLTAKVPRPAMCINTKHDPDRILYL